MTNPGCKEVRSFFPWPQFGAELGFEPGAGPLLTAVASLPRGGRGLQVSAQVYPSVLALATLVAPSLACRVPAQALSTYSRHTVAAFLGLSFGDLFKSCKNGSEISEILFHLLLCHGVGEGWGMFGGCILRAMTNTYSFPSACCVLVSVVLLKPYDSPRRSVLQTRKRRHGEDR